MTRFQSAYGAMVPPPVPQPPATDVVSMMLGLNDVPVADRLANADALLAAYPGAEAHAAELQAIRSGGHSREGVARKRARAMPESLGGISRRISGLGAPFPMPAKAATPSESENYRIVSKPEPGRPYMQRTDHVYPDGRVESSSKLVPYREKGIVNSNPADIALKVLRGQPLTDYEQGLYTKRQEYLANRAAAEQQRNKALARDYYREPFDDLEFSRADLDLLRRRSPGLAAQVQGQAADRRARIGDRADLREYQQGQLGLGRDELRSREEQGELDRQSQERIAGMRDGSDRLSGTAEQMIGAKVVADYEAGAYGDKADPQSWINAMKDADYQRKIARGETPSTPPLVSKKQVQTQTAVETAISKAPSPEAALKALNENQNPDTVKRLLREKFGDVAVEEFVKNLQDRKIRASEYVASEDTRKTKRKSLEAPGGLNSILRKMGIEPVNIDKIPTLTLDDLRAEGHPMSY